MAEPSRQGSRARRARAMALGLVLSGAFYLLLIDITDLPELIVGAAATVLAAIGTELAREQALSGGGVRPQWLIRTYRALAKVPSDVALVSIAAVAQLTRRESAVGRFRAVPFAAPQDEQRDGGREALAEAFGSFAPNTIIVGIDRERELILAHQLRPRGGREGVDVLRLGDG